MISDFFSSIWLDVLAVATFSCGFVTTTVLTGFAFAVDFCTLVIIGKFLLIIKAVGCEILAFPRVNVRGAGFSCGGKRVMCDVPCFNITLVVPFSVVVPFTSWIWFVVSVGNDRLEMVGVFWCWGFTADIMGTLFNAGTGLDVDQIEFGFNVGNGLLNRT